MCIFFKIRYSWLALQLPNSSRWFHCGQYELYNVQDVLQDVFYCIFTDYCSSARMLLPKTDSFFVLLGVVCCGVSITRAAGERLRDFHCWCRNVYGVFYKCISCFLLLLSLQIDALPVLRVFFNEGLLSHRCHLVASLSWPAVEKSYLYFICGNDRFSLYLHPLSKQYIFSMTNAKTNPDSVSLQSCSVPFKMGLGKTKKKTSHHSGRVAQIQFAPYSFLQKWSSHICLVPSSGSGAESRVTEAAQFFSLMHVCFCPR